MTPPKDPLVEEILKEYTKLCKGSPFPKKGSPSFKAHNNFLLQVVERVRKDENKKYKVGISELVARYPELRTAIGSLLYQKSLQPISSGKGK
jgi:hypothetical protein